MIVINNSLYLFTGFTGDGDEGSERQQNKPSLRNASERQTKSINITGTSKFFYIKYVHVHYVA